MNDMTTVERLKKEAEHVAREQAFKEKCDALYEAKNERAKHRDAALKTSKHAECRLAEDVLDDAADALEFVHGTSGLTPGYISVYSGRIEIGEFSDAEYHTQREAAYAERDGVEAAPEKSAHEKARDAARTKLVDAVRAAVAVYAKDLQEVAKNAINA